jgi:hypothetical protein
MNTSETNHQHGHRERLRQRFLSDPSSFSENELLELLLTYAIPRKDIVPLAAQLLERFADFDGVFNAPHEDLIEVDGIGEQAAILIKVIAQLSIDDISNTQPPKITQFPMQKKSEQPKLFDVEPELGPLFERKEEPQMRSYVQDEIANVLRFIPESIRFENVEGFKNYLEENLPYNSISTRRRRADYFINRYFPEKRINTPLTFFSGKCSDQVDLSHAVFYETLKAEPFVARIAEDVVWPALPTGYVDKEILREFIVRHLEDLGTSSLNKMLRAIFKTYDLLSVGEPEGDLLHIQIHKGTLEGFLYVLAAQYPRPGVYSFDSLYEGPMRHWLLWDKEWMRQQLYNLQDAAIISKVSEIDTVKQFTLQHDQMTALRNYFNNKLDPLSIREKIS